MISATVITGGSGGIGRAIINASPERTFINLSLKPPTDPQPNELFFEGDARSRVDTRLTAEHLARDGFQVRALINTAGINRLCRFEDLEYGEFSEVMATNCWSIVTATQAFLADLQATRGMVCNVVSNASHTPMTHSLAYNASKAAAHIVTQQMARELSKTHGITVFGLSPAKVAGTGMSREIEQRVQELRGWTAEEARDYQLNALLWGREIPPDDIGRLVAFLLGHPATVTRFFSGCVIPYGA